MGPSLQSLSMGSSMDVGSAAFGEKKVLNRIKVKFALKWPIWREKSSESEKSGISLKTRDLARKKFRIEKK